MKNREITFYSLLDSSQLRHIEEMADEMSVESFVNLGYERKWNHHLWIGANNEAFMDRLSNVDDLKKLEGVLSQQIKRYTRKMGEGIEELYSPYDTRKSWLNHTIFVCKNEFNKTQNEIFNEAVRWCEDWKKEWLDTFKSNNSKEDNAGRMHQTIFEKINGIDNDKGWKYAFRSRENLDLFIELLTCFFEQREYELPGEVIRLRKGSKTRMATIIKEIHSELVVANRTLKGDNEFLDIVRILHPFSHTSDLYKTISR